VFSPAVAADKGDDALGCYRREFVVAVGMGSGLQGESVERGGDHEPGQLLGGDVGIVDTQEPAGGESAAATPLERRAVGDAALDRGRPQPWKVLTELLRTAILASVFAWIAHRAGDLNVSHALVLALITWVGFPLVLLTGSVIWEKVHPATAAMHAGDWLVKLLLIAVILGLLH
jgi:hypothetical protein